MRKSTTVRVVGFPIDLGADRRGVDMGPSALRIADVDKKLESLGYQIIDEGDIPIRNIEVQEIQDPHLKYLPEVLVRMRLGGQTNLSLRNVIRQNLQIRRALQRHCPGTSLPAWMVGKLLIRMRQFGARRQAARGMPEIP